MAQEGLRLVCDVLGTLICMDQDTRDAIESGMRTLELPANHMLVVPPGDTHDENDVYHKGSGEGGIQGEGSGEKARGFGVTEGKVFKKGALLFL